MAKLKSPWKLQCDLTLLPFSLASRSILRSEIRRLLYLFFPSLLWSSVLYSEVSCAERGLSLRFSGCWSCSSPGLPSPLESPISLLCVPPEATELCPTVSLPLKLSAAESSVGKKKKKHFDFNECAVQFLLQLAFTALLLCAWHCANFTYNV